LSHLRQILEKNNHSLKDVNEVYFASQPSAQTGLRVSLAFLATLQVLNPQIKIYHINTLLLQAGENDCLSLLTIDSRASKYHVAVYQNKNCLLTSQIIRQEELKKIMEIFPNFLILKDFQGVDFLTNFQKLKGDFVRLKKIEEINL
jgi:tRNA threonylcarbamoyladenosine biosynthesis protein TsaB